MNKFIELIRSEIHSGAAAEDLVDLIAEATIPLVIAVSETTGMPPAAIIDYFQHKQDTEIVKFMQHLQQAD